nr:cilia- and flagella-associated protein 97-like [Nomia melanderi]
METNCECQYTLMVMNEIVQGQLSETKDNFNYVPSIHEVDEEDTDEEYVYDQDSTTPNEVQQDLDLTKTTTDDDSIYSNESFCSDESEETNNTSRTLIDSNYTPKITGRDCEEEEEEEEEENEEDEEKCDSTIPDRENINSLCCRSSASDKTVAFKTVKCRRKNMSFTDEELRKIEWENQILLRKIMAQQKPKEKILYENVPQPRISSSAINRKKLQKKIESENILLLQRLQQTKSRLMHTTKKPGCRQTIL